MFRQPVALIGSKGRQNKGGKRQSNKRGKKKTAYKVILCMSKRALALATTVST